MIKDLSNKKGPEWAKDFGEKKFRKCKFAGKEELLRAFQNLPYDAELIDVEEFLAMFDSDCVWYTAKLVK